MSLIPDLGSLDPAARALDQHAGELRDRVTQLGGAVASVPWDSVAAQAFRDQADEICARLRQCADGLEHAADELRQHAATARHRAAEVSAGVSAALDAGVDLITSGLGGLL